MTFILNEFEIETAQIKAAHDFHRPNLQRAVLTLARLMEWTNSNSDGWAHWSKPAAASKKLQEVIYTRYFGRDSHHFDAADVSLTDLKRGQATIKAFLTRQGVDHAVVFPNDGPWDR